MGSGPYHHPLMREPRVDSGTDHNGPVMDARTDHNGSMVIMVIIIHCAKR
jgi:hypothetical protein